MTISEATAETLCLDPIERSRYNFQPCSNKVERTEGGEELVSFRVLDKDCCRIQPFWETPGDIEGDAYHDYIARHPDFDIMMRQGASERLNYAASLLPRGWQLVIKAGFRPYQVQIAVLEAFLQESKQHHPSWNDAQHLSHVRTFVADPRIVCPPHVTGGAIDVDVWKREGNTFVDMGCPPNTDNELSYLHSNLITPEQYDNRMVLLDAMLTAGFAPNPHEWWHYQYGETYWAAFYGHKATLYDLIEV